MGWATGPMRDGGAVSTNESVVGFAPRVGSSTFQSHGKASTSREKARSACRLFCADIDHTNEEVRASLKDWMSWLRDELGFLGWRFDFTKGFGAEFVKVWGRTTVQDHKEEREL